MAVVNALSWYLLVSIIGETIAQDVVGLNNDNMGAISAVGKSLRCSKLLTGRKGVYPTVCHPQRKDPLSGPSFCA